MVKSWFRAAPPALLVVMFFLSNAVSGQPAPAATAAAKVRETAAGGPGPTWWLPEDVSLHGYQVDNLFYVILVVTGIIFVVVEALLVAFVWKYRARPGRKAVYLHGHKGLEITWTVATTIILFGIVFLTKKSWSAIKMSDPPAEARLVDLTAQQFTWKFSLPGTGEQYGKTSDIAPPERLIHVEEGKPVVFHMKSIDVIHSLYIPQMRIKQDIVPGSPWRVWFTPMKAGKYEIACAELCGAEHWSMRGVIHVDTPPEYQKWIQSELKYLTDKPK